VTIVLNRVWHEVPHWRGESKNAGALFMRPQALRPV
jgi:hypothetical protein